MFVKNVFLLKLPFDNYYQSLKYWTTVSIVLFNPSVLFKFVEYLPPPITAFTETKATFTPLRSLQQNCKPHGLFVKDWN